ncbi:MAG: hypothetical protein EPO26_08740 [Chloroflexota bacterium]|nr:MAG: hypothetical protein EPO26_08740 [Chloroflexota bacterium]
MLINAAIARFLADLEIGRSPATVRTYGVALRRLLEYRDDRAPTIQDVADLAIELPLDFTRQLAREKVPRSTIETYTTAVSRFYAYLVREEIRPDLQLEAMQLRLAALRGRRHRALPRVPADDVVERVLAAARTIPLPTSRPADLARRRDIAIVETLRGSGVRVSELVSLRRGDLNHSTNGAIITGKGGKQRLVLFTQAAWAAIDDYLVTRADTAIGRGLAALPVFSRHDRAARRPATLSTNAVREIIWSLATQAGLADSGLTPHRFRAWFATHLVAETGDLAAVQDLLGHESADTTRIYTKVAARRLRDIHSRAFGETVPHAESA